MSDNLKLWKQVQTTDPEFAKPFNSGRFSGTSANPIYLARLATDKFGPCGIGWGHEEIESRLIEGAPQDDSGLRESYWQSHVRLWYVIEDKRGEISHWGQSPFLSYSRKNSYWYSDGEAPKKARTNAVSKCLSLLGFSADLWMGYYDSAEYRNKTAPETIAEQKRRESHESACGMLKTLLEKGIGCNPETTPADHDAVIRWASDYSGWADVLATEGAPVAVQRAISETGKPYPTILAEAKGQTDAA